MEENIWKILKITYYLLFDELDTTAKLLQVEIFFRIFIVNNRYYWNIFV